MISAVILTKNEEQNIIDCIENVLFCDEIVIVDDYSKDRTIDIIKNLNKAKIKIFRRRVDSNFSEQRNYGLSKAKGEWVLFVDADERVSEALVSEIQEYQTSDTNRGYFIGRIDYIWGKELKHGETGHIKLLRLARKDAGKWRGKVHEIWKVKGRIGELKNPLIHFPHKSVKEFLHEINKYSTIRASELFEAEVKVSWLSIVLYPTSKFLLNFFGKLGFLDGTAGFAHAMLMSFHSFLVRVRLWLLWKKH